MQETRVWCLAQEDPLEKGVAFCSVPWRHRGQGLFSIVFLASAFRWLLSPLHLYFSSLAACRWPFQAQSSLFLQEIPFNSSGYCLLWVPEHLLAPRTWIISPLYWWYRTSLVAQMLKNLWAMQETWFWSVGGEDPLEKGMATHSSIGVLQLATQLQYSCLKTFMDIGAWWAAVHGVTKSQTWLSTHTHTYIWGNTSLSALLPGTTEPNTTQIWSWHCP